MTNGSCQSRCESNVQTWLKPASSALRARSTTADAGGSHWNTTPKSTGFSHLDQVRREPAPQVPSVPLAAVVVAVSNDDVASRDHRVHVAGDLETLVRRIVHVHVVRLD